MATFSELNVSEVRDSTYGEGLNKGFSFKYSKMFALLKRLTHFVLLTSKLHHMSQLAPVLSKEQNIMIFFYY